MKTLLKKLKGNFNNGFTTIKTNDALTAEQKLQKQVNLGLVLRATGGMW